MKGVLFRLVVLPNATCKRSLKHKETDMRGLRSEGGLCVCLFVPVMVQIHHRFWGDK